MALKQKKRKHTEELHAFAKMSFSYSDQESISSSTSKEDNNHSSKILKQHTQSFK